VPGAASAPGTVSGCRTGAPATVSGMDVEDAIRSRRTHKAFAPEPLPRELLDELLELARWAPNHHLTNPWRFRVLGPDALSRLKQAAGPEAAAKLDRAPTLIAATAKRDGDPVQDEEDLCATAAATYAVLLAAHARGLAGYWRTPGVLRTEEGRAALGIPPDERFVALIHLGWPRQEKEPPERLPPDDVVTYLG
jgi:nitroreductase